MKFILAVYVTIFFISCGGPINSDKVQSRKENINDLSRNRDTIIVYNVDDISSEGAEAKAFYRNNKIVKSDISIFGETGQIKIVYSFLDDTINVKEKQFKYSNGIEDANASGGMFLIKEFNYKLSVSGTAITHIDSGATNIFKEFTKIVPFKIE